MSSKALEKPTHEALSSGPAAIRWWRSIDTVTQPPPRSPPHSSPLERLDSQSRFHVAGRGAVQLILLLWAIKGEVPVLLAESTPLVFLGRFPVFAAFDARSAGVLFARC